MAEGILKDMFKIGKFKISVEYDAIQDVWKFGYVPTEKHVFEGDEGRRVYYLLWRMECLQDDIEELYEEIEKAKKKRDNHE